MDALDSDVDNFQDNASYIVNGPDEDRMLKLKRQQMSTGTLSRIFKLAPESIILYGSDDSVVPCSNGTFTHLSSFLTWTVTGEVKAPSKCNPFSFGQNVGAGGSGSVDDQHLSGPSKRHSHQKKRKFTSGTSAPSINKDKTETFTKNFVICEVFGGDLLERKSTTLMLHGDVTTRDIKRLLIQESDFFKSSKSEGAVTLLDSKGLEIENTTATKGRSFWGTNRKIKAVRTSDWVKRKHVGLKLPPTTGTSSSSENELVSVPEESSPVTLQSVYKGVSKIEELVKGLSNSKKNDELAAIFKCKICFETSKHPVLTTKCCLNVAGCYECFRKCDNLQSCILCRAEIKAEDAPMGMYSEMPPIRGIYELAGIDIPTQ